MKSSFWKKLNTGWKILLIAGIVVVVFILIALIYLADYHHAEEDALKEALSNPAVDVKEITADRV